MASRPPEATRSALPPTTPEAQTKGSGYDHNRRDDTEDGRRTDDGERNEACAADGKQSDDTDGGASGPDSVQHWRARKAATVRTTQTAVDGSGSRLGALRAESNRGAATFEAGPDGTLWVAVDGKDIEELAARISEACDMLRQ